MGEAEWREAMQLGARVGRVIDLDEREREYKVAHALKAREARAAVENNAADWPNFVRRALKLNLVYYLTQSRVMVALEADRVAGRAALQSLWASGGSAQGVAEFYRFLGVANHEVRMGAAMVSASVLLMALGATDHPPYQTETVNRFARLVGQEPAPTSDVAARWDQFRGLLDGIREHAAEAGAAIRDDLDAQGLLFTLARVKPDEIPDAALARDIAAWRGDAEAAASSVARETYDRPEVEDAGWRVLKAGLLGEPSPFTGQPSAWTVETALSLRERNLDEDVAGSGTYMEKFERQLAGASDAEYQLAAELLFLHHLPLANVNASTKVERVEAVRDWSGGGWQLPDWARAAASAEGAFHGGQGYSAQRWRHIVWLCGFVAKWAALDPSAKDAALADPWAFFRQLDGVEPDIAAMRYLLAYYAWPNVFLHIVSPTHRRSIRDAFADEIGGSTGDTDLAISRDLFDLRNVFEERRGARLHFYEPDLLEQWWADKTRRAWFIKLDADPRETWERWTELQEVSLAANELASHQSGASLDRIAAAVADARTDESTDAQLRRARELHAFVSRVKDGDLVVTLVDGSLRFAEVTGGLAEAPDPAGELSIPVAWLDAKADFESVPEALASALDFPGVLLEVTKAIVDIDDLIAAGPDGEAAPETQSASRTLSFAPIPDEAVRDLHMSREYLEEFAGLLWTRRQLVFHGPPGTGKTFVARRLARALAGADRTGAIALVQFHPSYAYEDFFEGFRPRETSTGQASFALTPGPLRLLADEAARPENAHKPYFLIIDEMNRGNLAKVFGELYFLLEYRSQAVSPQYSPTTRFSLPDNLFIIGTMNTTDRSVGLIDAAIRRRFPFVELHPDSSPVEGVLRAFLDQTGQGLERAALLRALNSRIETRDLRIGPSYFMRAECETEAGLRQVWRYDIMPLLHEHFYGKRSPEAIEAEFSLEAVRATLGGRAGTGDVLPESEE